MLDRSTLDGRVFRARDAIDAGLVTPDGLRSRSWQRLFHGIYADASLVVTHDVRCAAAVVFDTGGRFVARLDLAWPEHKVGVEYDGLWHVGSTSQIHSDRRRHGALARLGWTLLYVTSTRLRDDLPASPPSFGPSCGARRPRSDQPGPARHRGTQEVTNRAQRG